MLLLYIIPSYSTQAGRAKHQEMNIQDLMFTVTGDTSFVQLVFEWQFVTKTGWFLYLLLVYTISPSECCII